ncbi:MAG: hypothetical protein PHS37_07180 [Candidatus Omnitrophica bacterium]|nr:hypothetical protein [Candidatus Omnitrophota bacterium]
MSITKRRQIRYKQRVRRKKRRANLKKKGLDPEQHYHGGICLGIPKDR